jgi:hypothetical protein
MYTDIDCKKSHSAFLARVLATAFILAVGLGCIVTAMVMRVRWLAGIASALTACLVYAYISLKVMPHYWYKHMLDDMREGLTRDTEGRFVSIAAEPRKSDGVLVRDFIVRVGESEEDERLFYWDCDKPAPDLKPGDCVHIKSFGNYIKELLSV